MGRGAVERKKEGKGNQGFLGAWLKGGGGSRWVWRSQESAREVGSEGEEGPQEGRKKLEGSKPASNAEIKGSP